MRCFSARKRLSPYIDAELEAGEARKLESHLERCRRCAAEFEEMAGVHRLFTGVERFPAPQGFSARVMGKIHAQSSKDISMVSLLVRFAGAAAIALAIAAGIVSGDILVRSHHDPAGETVMASLSLETFEALPPGSLGKAYLTMTEERR